MAQPPNNNQMLNPPPSKATENYDLAVSLQLKSMTSMGHANGHAHVVGRANPKRAAPNGTWYTNS